MGIGLIAVLTVVIVTIIVFSILVKRKRPNEYWNWWISFIATIVSLMLGLVVGIFLFEYSQDRTKSDDKERITAALEAELSGIYRILIDGEKFNIKVAEDQKIEVLMVNLSQIIVDDAIRSNLFDKDATTHLINISRNIKMLDTSVDNLWDFIHVAAVFNAEYRMKFIKTSVANIEKFQNNIKKRIEILEPLLNRKFTKKET